MYTVVVVFLFNLTGKSSDFMKIHDIRLHPYPVRKGKKLRVEVDYHLCEILRGEGERGRERQTDIQTEGRRRRVCK